MSKSTQTAETGARHRKLRGRDLNTNDIAAAALPFITRIRRELPGIRAVLLGTRDGIHICSVGLSKPEDAARLSALNSSMYGVSGAQVQLMGHPDAAGGETVVAVTMPDEIIMVVSVDYEPVNNLLLWVSAEDTQLGMVIHHIRNAADELAEWLVDD